MLETAEQLAAFCAAWETKQCWSFAVVARDPLSAKPPVSAEYRLPDIPQARRAFYGVRLLAGDLSSCCCCCVKYPGHVWSETWVHALW